MVIWVPGGETRPYKAKLSLSRKSKEWGYFIRKQSSTVRARGADERDLMRLAHEQGIEARVRFYENLRREELLQRYANADLFVLLSRHEAYGISVAEALASGIPCIVLKASALQEWVDNKNVFGIDYPIDLDELASMIKTSIGEKVERTDLCTWDMVTEDLERIYEELQ